MNIIQGKRERLEKQAAKVLEDSLQKILVKKPYAVFAVAGGTSVSGIFKLLQSSSVPWEKVHFFMLDERWVPSGHAESNEKLLRKDLTNHIDIPEENIHSFDIEKGVEEYREQFEAIGSHIDVSLISAGEDGHIASLYPNHSSTESKGDGYIEVVNSPKPPPHRISLSKKTISESDTAVLLFFGEGKKDALKNFQDESLSVQDCPAKIVQEISDQYIFTDIQ